MAVSSSERMICAGIQDKGSKERSSAAALRMLRKVSPMDRVPVALISIGAKSAAVFLPAGCCARISLWVRRGAIGAYLKLVKEQLRCTSWCCAGCHSEYGASGAYL